VKVELGRQSRHRGRMVWVVFALGLAPGSGAALGRALLDDAGTVTHC